MILVGDIKVNKYMVEITTYPDGRQFHKMYPIGETKKQYSSAGKARKKAPLESSKSERAPDTVF